MRRLTASMTPSAISALLLALLASIAFGQDALQSDAGNSLPSSPTTLQEDEFIQPEDAFQFSIDVQPDAITLHWDIVPNYYLAKEMFRVSAYYFDEQGEGQEAALDLSYEKGKISYDPYFEKDVEKYFTQTNVRFPPPTNVRNFQLEVISQGCSPTLCYPPYRNRLAINLDRGTYETIAQITAKPDAGSGGGLLSSAGTSGDDVQAMTATIALIALASAFIGGILLNAFPCVFPILSIKALSFVSSHQSGHSQHLHGWAYTAGAVITFMAFGLIAAALDAVWGAHLGNPYFSVPLLILFVVMGLSLSGFFNIGTQLMGVGQSLTVRQGLQGSFFTGALAVVVATPCTIPFMASALAVAMSQPGPITVAIFAVLGFGMALPFLLLSYSPKFAGLLPKPGPWMETFKHSMSFPMYLTAIWLFSIVAAQLTNLPQQNITFIAWLTAAIAFAAFAVWLFGKNPASDRGKKILGMAVSTSFIAAVGIAYSAKDLSSDEGWQSYSPELVAELRSQGRPVFVNLTAAWCITCHANERVALSRDEVQRTAQTLNVAMVKGDYTNEDPRIKALLDEYRRVGVPTYLMFPADTSKPPEILPQILTVNTVVAAMQRSVGDTAVAAVN
jgi:thiol:disulfide interchange protein DsbD